MKQLLFTFVILLACIQHLEPLDLLGSISLGASHLHPPPSTIYTKLVAFQAHLLSLQTNLGNLSSRIG